MDLTALRTALRTRTGMKSTDKLAGDAELDLIINAALHRIETANPNGWSWLIRNGTVNVTAGQDRLPFSTLRPSDTVMKVLGVWLEAQGTHTLEMMRLGRDEMMLRYSSEVQSRPQVWSTVGGELWIRPVPDTTYTLRHDTLIAEPDLAGSDTPLMPAIYHDAIVEQAAYLLYRRTQNLVDAEGAQVELREWLKQMMGHEREYRGAGRVRDVGRMWGEDYAY